MNRPLYFDDIESYRTPVAYVCKETREAAGISVDEFAKFAGVTRQTVYNFENGEAVSLQVFMAYYRLGCSYKEWKERQFKEV